MPADYAVTLTFDHASLVAQSKAAAGGEDLRVVRRVGSNWAEVDRIPAEGSGWNRSSTTILFRAPDALGPNAVSSSYYLYFGCASPGAPPADPAKVFWYFSDFSSLDALGDWSVRDVDEISEWSIREGVLFQSRNAEQESTLPYVNSKLVLTARPPVRDLSVAFDFYPLDNDLTAVGLCSDDSSPEGFYLAASRDRWFDGDDQGSQVGYWAGPTDTDSRPIPYPIERWHHVDLRWDADGISFLLGGEQAGWASGPGAAGFFCFALNAMEGVRFDNLTLRRYVPAEPGVGLGSEESRP